MLFSRINLAMEISTVIGGDELAGRSLSLR
jgi:hypothetical protein